METAAEDRHAAAHWLRPRLDRRADLTVQRKALATLGVTAERIYVDYGSTGPNRERPGRREALAACRGGDTLVVINSTGWRARCLTPRLILEDLTRREVRLSLGGFVHGTDPVGRLLFNVFALVAEFEANLIRLRTRRGQRSPRSKGRLRGGRDHGFLLTSDHRNSPG